ncbi:MAG: FAD-dependent oxidoreductase, partial [Alphaproteobacteria bacterium]|nr:FAD-dependent oxidoreductase [Alphaproteobacteria bacterium]
MEHETDVAIVGAGPVGLFAVFELGMLQMRAHVVDSLEAVGGQCTALYPEKPIYDIPGFPRVDACDLVARLEEQAAPFSPVYHLDRKVEALTPLEGGWRVEIAEGSAIRCKAVIVAAGAGAFGPNRPPLEGLAAYEGRSVFY